jgi:hypothetical protein
MTSLGFPQELRRVGATTRPNGNLELRSADLDACNTASETLFKGPIGFCDSVLTQTQITCGTSSRSVCRLILAALLTAASVGCSNPTLAPDGADLESRVQAWWSARQTGDVARMYEMMEPSFRATTPMSTFGVHANRLRRIAIENPRTVAVVPVPNSNRVVVTLVARTLLPKTGRFVDIDIRDEWVLEDGKWWRVYVAPRTPFE